MQFLMAFENPAVARIYRDLLTHEKVKVETRGLEIKSGQTSSQNIADRPKSSHPSLWVTPEHFDRAHSLLTEAMARMTLEVEEQKCEYWFENCPANLNICQYCQTDESDKDC